MKLIRNSKLEGARLLASQQFFDSRGFFVESYNRDKLQELDIEDDFLQDNHSYSQEGVIRGMHFHRHHEQVKLVRCPIGQIYDVVVDVRPDSPTYRQWDSFILSEANGFMLYIPGGFAHGFAALMPSHVMYKCSTTYDPENELTFAYNDVDVGIEWPSTEPVMSDRDREALSLTEVEEKI